MWALNPIPNTWGDRIGAFAERVARERAVVATDGSWRSGLSPVTGNGFYHDEDYGTRIATADTHGVEVLPFDTGLLVPRKALPVIEMGAVTAIETWGDADATVFDFDQHCGAHARIAVMGPAVAKVRVAFCEVLGPDRALDTRNFRSAQAKPHYTLIGDPMAGALRKRAEVIRAAFMHAFFSPSGRIAHNDQTSWSLAFLYGLVPPEYHEAGKAYFRRVIEDADGLIGTGIIGTPATLPALTMHEMADFSEITFLNHKVPGWL